MKTRKSLNKLLILIAVGIVTLYLCCIGSILLVLWFMFTPSPYYTTAKAEQKNGSYEISIKYADYGGSYGSCSSKYGEGNTFLKYHVGQSCGGIHIHAFLVNKKNPFEIYDLEDIPDDVECGPEGGKCATKQVERLEDFELSKDRKYITWYDEKIYYK